MSELIERKADELAGMLSVSEMAIEDLDSQIKTLQAKKKKLSNELDLFKDELRQAMTDSGILRIESEGVLFRLDPAVIVVNIECEGDVPDKFWRIKKDLDRTAIKKALQVGDDVPGASLKEGKHRLTIKV